MSGLFQSVQQLEGALTFHRQRQTVLAGNLANVDTPGFKPMDIERVGFAFQNRSGSIELASSSTQSGHLTSGGPSPEVRVFEDAGDYQSANGNAVNLERELAKLDANRVRYDTGTALVSRRLAILKYAAADGVG